MGLLKSQEVYSSTTYSDSFTMSQCPRESECTLVVVVVLVLVGEAKHRCHLVGKVLSGVVKKVREKREMLASRRNLCCNLLVW